ncbi:hypothetical protein BDM02DRAFT_3021648 [Thelephora ganbajun]|uniref:Uncharacterized protein n=1 Tax=Thelephora ganbajun TaxID=370292 RepID=A0ACB6ZAW6_THEGA|nr:hypothetical protein BDM02DRAFT_3021648 [Thelephora ganbajun]
MASEQRGWMTYKQQMGLLGHGDALWEPAPIYSYKRVKLGDVGYIRRGRFHLLFSAGYPLGLRQLGVDVPITFEQLDIGHIISSQPRSPGYVCTSTVRETGAGLGASFSMTSSLEPGARFSFELTKKQGAALITKYPTYREDIELESAFEEYTRHHYDSWVKFARDAQHGNDIKPVLVTGVDVTRDFAMIAYSNNSTHLSSEFVTSIPPVAPASTSVWGAWYTQGLVHTNCGPQLCSPPSSSGASNFNSFDNDQVDASPSQYSQCVFVRYYTMRRRAGMFPRIIKAAAELMVQSDTDSDAGSGRSSNSTTNYSSLVTGHESELKVFRNASSEGEDPFDIIAEYIFKNSKAEAVLIHHRDIAQMREGMPEAEMSELLSERQPLIVVDSVGVGRLVHQTHQQLTVTLPGTTSPSSSGQHHNFSREMGIHFPSSVSEEIPAQIVDRAQIISVHFPYKITLPLTVSANKSAAHFTTLRPSRFRLQWTPSSTSFAATGGQLRFSIRAISVLPPQLAMIDDLRISTLWVW